MPNPSEGALKLYWLMIDQPAYDIWTGSDDSVVHELIAELHEAGLIEYYSGIKIKTIGYEPKG